MANFITTSITWAGKETLDFFFTPLFIGKSPYETQGVRIMPNVQSVQKLNFIGAANKITKAYSKGFSGTNSTSYTQRNLTVYQLKAEKAQDANEFYQTVLETIQGKGYTWNDIKASQGGLINEIIMESFIRALESDIFRIFWLADTAKETVTSSRWSGTADANYSMFDGMLVQLIDNASTSPSASQFFKVAMTHGAVAQVDTVTLSSGGAGAVVDIPINTTTYRATYDTSLTTTAANFVTTHAAALLVRDIVATSASGVITLTSNRAGRPFTCTTTAGSGMTATRAASVANTLPSALAADEAIGYCRSLYKDSDVVLRNLPNNQKVFLMDAESYENLQETLESTAVPNSYDKLENGVEVLKYRGVVCLKMDWDEYLADNTEFPPGYPNIIIYTYVQNLVLGIDSTDERAMIQEWLNEDEQENRFRAQWKMGASYVHPKYTAIAF